MFDNPSRILPDPVDSREFSFFNRIVKASFAKKAKSREDLQSQRLAAARAGPMSSAPRSLAPQSIFCPDYS